MARLATIDLDWLNGEIDNLLQKGANPKGSSTADDIRFCSFLSILEKCTPIEVEENKASGLKPEPLPKYCKVKDKEYCFLHNQCQECTDNNSIK